MNLYNRLDGFHEERIVSQTIGSDSGSFVIYDDGSEVRTGDATYFEDVVAPLLGKKLFAVSGKVDYDFDNLALEFAPSGVAATKADNLVFSVQKPHGAKVDSVFALHIHWLQDTAVTRTLNIQYRIQESGAAVATEWIEDDIVLDTTNAIFAYDSGTINQINQLIDIDWSGCPISSTLQVKITRTDANTGDLLATFIDGHVEFDTIGSKEEFVK